MEDELIAGTDKEAELLNLLCIKAIAIFVRILVPEDAPTAQASYFTNILSDIW